MENFKDMTEEYYRRVEEIQDEVGDSMQYLVSKDVKAHGLFRKNNGTSHSWLEWDWITGVVEEVEVDFCSGFPELNIMIDGIQVSAVDEFEVLS